MSLKLNRRAFLGTALTFGAICAVSPADAFGVTAAEKKSEVQSIKSKLDAMNDELDSAVDKYNQTQDSYEDATSKVEACQSKIASAEAKIKKLQGHLSTRAASMYRNGSMSYLDVLLGVGSFDDFATVWDTLNNLNEDDADLVSQTKVAKSELESARKELAEQQAKAKSQVNEAAALKSQIKSKTSAYESQYNSLSSEYKKLLAQEEAAQSKAASKASKTYTPSTSSGGSSSGSSSSGGSSSGGGSSSSGGGSHIPSHGGVVDYARSRIGCPYVWGASGPNKFDCSGLTMWCYAQIGISIPHYTESQYSSAKARMSVYSASAGDVLYRSGHVSIYAGGNTYIHAPHTGDHVRTASGIGSFSAALRF